MNIFQRTELLFGKTYIEKASQTKVILFGVGGVGSWCAEMLIRSSIGHLTLVDYDKVAISNINRQLPATTRTVGQVKVEVLKDRLQEINPNAEIIALQSLYSKDTCDSFHLESYDYIIDAIDDFENKVHLIQAACKTNAILFSSMGAALKTDPTKIQVADFWKTKGCRLAAAVRKKIKHNGGVPKKFKCVFSEEHFRNSGELLTYDEELAKEEIIDERADLIHPPSSLKKARVNGTVSYMPAMFGMTIAGLITQEINKSIKIDPIMKE